MYVYDSYYWLLAPETLLQNPPNDRTYFTHVSTANFANFKTLFLALYLLKIQSENGFEVGR